MITVTLSDDVAQAMEDAAEAALTSDKPVGIQASKLAQGIVAIRAARENPTTLKPCMYCGSLNGETDNPSCLALGCLHR